VPAQTTDIEWSVSVLKSGVPVNTAAVSVNGKVVPPVGGFSDGWYSLNYFQSPANTSGEATYLVGQSYTVTVVVDGTSYTDTMKAPGGITMDATGSSVSWAEQGTYASAHVSHLFGSVTFTAPQPGPAAISSPLAIPASAYPGADTYQITAGVQNIRLPAGAYPGFGYFGSLVGHLTHFVIEDHRIQRVTK